MILAPHHRAASVCGPPLQGWELHEGKSTLVFPTVASSRHGRVPGGGKHPVHPVPTSLPCWALDVAMGACLRELGK